VCAPLLQVVDELGIERILAIKDNSTVRPRDHLLPQAGLLLPDTHLPIGLEQGHSAELSDQGEPEAVHFVVVCLAGCIELVQCRSKHVATVVQAMLELGIGEVPYKRIRFLFKQSPELLDGSGVVLWKISKFKHRCPGFMAACAHVRSIARRCGC